MIEVDNIVLLCAFRYALGRRTYITGVISEEIERNWNKISEEHQNIILKEIKEAIETENAGDIHCDVPCWKKILALRRF